MKFSIITPCFNRADLIERAIISIQNQTHKNFEMIIVDDASTDDTVRIVEQFLNDDRIRLIKCKENGGVNVARNIGLNNLSADSDAITFLDSDDEFKLDALENMYLEMERINNINYFRFGVEYENGKPASRSEHTNKITDYKYYIKNLFTIGEWVCTFRRKIIDDGFNYSPEVNAFEIISYIELAKKEKMFISEKVVRIYHTGHESISNEPITKAKLANTINGYNLILKNDIKTISANNYGILNYTLANLYILQGEKIKGLKLTLKTLLVKPIDLRVFRNLMNFILK